MRLFFHIYKRLPIDRQVSKFHKAFANSLSGHMKLAKTQLFKVVQPGGFFGRLLGPWMKTFLPLMKNVFKPLAKNVLIPLGLTATSSADDGIHRTILGSEQQHIQFQTKKYGNS